MKKLDCWLNVGIVALAAVLFGSVAVFADVEKTSAAQKTGTVTGKINVVKTKVKTKGPKSYKDVIVFLEHVVEKGAKKKACPVPDKHVVINQEGLVFIPHVTVVQKGTTIDFLNNDNVNHNIFCRDNCCKILDGQKGKKPQFMDLGSWKQGTMRSYTFNISGEAVLLCRLHPEMAAYVLVVDTPFFTVAAIDGLSQSADYVIKNVPPGKYVLKTWNKKCVSQVREITVKEGQSTQADIEITRKTRKRRR